MMTIEEFHAEGHEPGDIEAMAQIQLHPGFPSVMRRLMEDMMDQSRPQLRAAGHRHYLVCLLTFFLYSRPEGLTVSSLRELCAEGGYPRAMGRPMLAYLRFARYVEPLRGQGGDRREHRFQPTADLRADFHSRMCREVAIIGDIEPDAARAAGRMHDYDFFLGFMNSYGAQLIDGRRRSTPDPGGLALFSERTGGFPLILHLALGRPDDSAMPPEAPVPYSISRLARIARSSRVHVLRLLRDAEAAHLVKRVSESEIVLLPRVRTDLRTYYGAICWGYGSFARWALKHVDGEPGAAAAPLADRAASA